MHDVCPRFWDALSRKEICGRSPVLPETSGVQQGAANGPLLVDGALLHGHLLLARVAVEELAQLRRDEKAPLRAGLSQ